MDEKAELPLSYHSEDLMIHKPRFTENRPLSVF